MEAIINLFPINILKMKRKSALLIFLVLFTCGLAEATTQEEPISLAMSQQTFVDIRNFHKICMLYSWTILADVITLLVFYEYRKYTKITHSILGFSIIATTITTSMPSLLRYGVVHHKFYRHYLIGVILYGVMGLQLLLGVTKFALIYFRKANSFAIFIIKMMHKYLGYVLLIGAKVSVFLQVSSERTEYSILIGWEVAVGVIFFYRLFTFRKLTTAIIPEIDVKKKVTNLNELQLQNKKVIIFANYIFDATPLQLWHPAGHNVIKPILNESADKYLYGMYGSEVETRIPRYSHSETSIKLLAEPLAKINIPSPFEGFQKDVVKVRAVQINQVSKHVYEIKLVKDEGFNFVFKGYSDISQIGRYYSFTIDDKVTRLYTTVNFLHKDNKDLLKSVYFGPHSINIDNSNIINAQSGSVLINQSSISGGTQQASEENQLSLLIKRYEKGAFTQQILSLTQKSLKLSSQRGFGLSLPNLQPGRVVVVVGGTGLFPFCDLIDLLFKDCLCRNEGQAVASKVIPANPIIKNHSFDKFSFEFMGSFHCIEDVPKITLHQILYLCKHSTSFRFLFRIKKKVTEGGIAEGMTSTEKRFEELLGDEILTSNLSKVWVCGPPPMNSSLRKLLERTLSRSQFQIM